jgi:acyl-CoA reductase-like NAD-dependent aldehyde dehydrogenase
MTAAETATASGQQDWSQLRHAPYPLLIDGELVIPPDRATFDVIYPFTNQPVARVYAAGPAEVDRAVAAARRAVEGDWGHTTPAERQTVLLKLAGLIERDADYLSFLETNDVVYGLASAVWTRDIDRALRMTRAIHAGQVYVNSYYSPSMHETPMAGQKQSGVGEAGLTRYMQSKAAFINVSPHAP